jgi:aminoglycoside/choline kinase family phosphotransferase
MSVILLPRALERQGWSVQALIAGDGSTRHYARVVRYQTTAIFMDCSGPQTPGHALGDFIRIGEWLRGAGLSAPEILWSDEAAGFALAEDLGDLSLKAAITENPTSAAELYACAADVLKHLKKMPCPLDLPDFFNSSVYHGHRRVMDWYAPFILGRAVTDDELKTYQTLWADIERTMPPAQNGFVHIDYHAENLMWLPGRIGLKRIGILDFQGAMQGPPAYDWANLLMDARADIAPAIKAQLLAGQGGDFKFGFDVLGLQFHLRVLGQFIKLALQGKPQYLPFIPRLEAYIQENLHVQPDFKLLASFFADLGLRFDTNGSIALENAARWIRADAF